MSLLHSHSLRDLRSPPQNRRDNEPQGVFSATIPMPAAETASRLQSPWKREHVTPFGQTLVVSPSLDPQINRTLTKSGKASFARSLMPPARETRWRNAISLLTCRTKRPPNVFSPARLMFRCPLSPTCRSWQQNVLPRAVKRCHFAGLTSMLDMRARDKRCRPRGMQRRSAIYRQLPAQLRQRLGKSSARQRLERKNRAFATSVRPTLDRRARHDVSTASSDLQLLSMNSAD